MVISVLKILNVNHFMSTSPFHEAVFMLTGERSS
jgi:hypothetical protein